MSSSEYWSVAEEESLQYFFPMRRYHGPVEFPQSLSHYLSDWQTWRHHSHIRHLAGLVTIS